MPVSEPWEEVEFTRLDDGSDDFIAVDCLTMNTGADGFLVSAFAREVLSPVLESRGDFWPIRVFGLPYWWFNCMALVDALDRTKTDADWSVVDGDWGSFSWITTTRRLEFEPGRLHQAPIVFRVPEYPQGVLFARAELQDLVSAHGLTGFQFDLVWSANEGGVENPAGVGFGDVFEPIPVRDIEARRKTARDVLARRGRVRK